MERGEIWLVDLEPTKGREQRGKRPVFILSPSSFNQLTGVPVVLPITSGGRFARIRGFAVALTGAGLRTTGIVRCDQIRAVDFRARSGRRLEQAPQAIIDEVLARVAVIFE
jgi:mRNA-degrading endonuclease toxin of MazEF toxin-antitoxin module